MFQTNLLEFFPPLVSTHCTWLGERIIIKMQQHTNRPVYLLQFTCCVTKTANRRILFYVEKGINANTKPLIQRIRIKQLIWTWLHAYIIIV